MVHATMKKTALVAAALILAGAPGAAEAACTKSRLPDGKPRFELKAGEATDRTTGLVWSRCSLGTTWTSGKCDGERADVDHGEATAAAKSPWRLPTARELSALIDQDCDRPAIDTAVFPDVTASTDEGAEEFWTSTPGGINEMMVVIDLADGYGDIRSPGFKRSARMVRPAR